MLKNENVSVVQLTPCSGNKFAVFRGDHMNPNLICQVDLWALVKVYEKNIGTYTDITGVVMSKHEKVFCCSSRLFLSYADSYEEACEVLNSYQELSETVSMPTSALYNNN